MLISEPDATNTLTVEQKLETLTWLKCGSCAGRGNISKQSGGEFIQLNVYLTTKVAICPCPSCQDSSGVATGLMFPGLSEGCPQRIPLRHELLEAIETALNEFGHWEYMYLSNIMPYSHGYRIRFNGNVYHGITNEDRKEAAISALYAAAVAKGLVEEA